VRPVPLKSSASASFAHCATVLQPLCVLCQLANGLWPGTMVYGVLKLGPKGPNWCAVPRAPRRCPSWAQPESPVASVRPRDHDRGSGCASRAPRRAAVTTGRGRKNEPVSVPPGPASLTHGERRQSTRERVGVGGPRIQLTVESPHDDLLVRAPGDDGPRRGAILTSEGANSRDPP
jgi:hypothetical protein